MESLESQVWVRTGFDSNWKTPHTLYIPISWPRIENQRNEIRLTKLFNSLSSVSRPTKCLCELNISAGCGAKNKRAMCHFWPMGFAPAGQWAWSPWWRGAPVDIFQEMNLKKWEIQEVEGNRVAVGSVRELGLFKLVWMVETRGTTC